MKSLTFSAAGWAADKLDGPFYAKILQGAVRSPDPYLVTQGAWVGRRLSPDCRRLEVESLARVKDEEYLLHAMGFETANVQLGTTGARWPIQKHLAHYSKGKLKKAAINMKTMVLTDFRSCKTR